MAYEAKILICSTDGAGGIADLATTPAENQWSTCVAGRFSASSRFDSVLLYDRVGGRGLFVETDGAGHLHTLIDHTDWGDSWDLIIPGNFSPSPYTDLLFYDRSQGRGLFCLTDGKGNWKTLRDYADFSPGWTTIVTGAFSKSSYSGLLFYDREAGRGLFCESDGQGYLKTLKDHHNWGTSWEKTVVGRWNNQAGYSDLLFYDARHGRGLFYSADGAGDLSQIADHRDWGGDWAKIVAGDFNISTGGTDLLFYHRPSDRSANSDGRGLFAAVDYDGKLSYFADHNDWGQWQVILEGHFSLSARSDLFFYDNAIGRL